MSAIFFNGIGRLLYINNEIETEVKLYFLCWLIHGTSKHAPIELL